MESIKCVRIILQHIELPKGKSPACGEGLHKLYLPSEMSQDKEKKALKPRRPAAKSILLPILMLGFALRVLKLGSQELSYDETVSFFIASQDVRDMLPYLLKAHFEHPPLYYLLLQPWIRLLGESEFILRFPSVFFSVLSIPLAFHLGRKLFDEPLGNLLGFILALSPFQIYYAQDTRMYTLATFLGLLSVLLLIEFLREGKWALGVGYLTVCFLMSMTHYYTILLILFQDVYLFLLWRHYKPQSTKLFLLQGILALPLFAWVLLAAGFRESLRASTTAYLPRPFTQLLNDLKISFIEFSLGRELELQLASCLLLGFLLLLLLGVLGLHKASSQTNPRKCPRALAPKELFLLLYFFLPLLVATIMPFPLRSRLLLPITPAYYLLLSLGIVTLKNGPISPQIANLDATKRVSIKAGKMLSTLSLLFIVGAWFYSLGYYFRSYTKSDYKGAMQLIQRDTRPGDVIILDGPWQELLFRYYYEGALPHLCIPERVPPALDEQEAEPTLERTAKEYSRIWLVLSAEDIADPENFVEGWLRRHARVTLDREFGNAHLLLFELPQNGRTES